MCSDYFKHFLVILSLIAPVISWKVEFEPNKTTISAGNHQRIEIILSELPENVIKNFVNGENKLIEIKSEDESLVGIESHKTSKWIEIDRDNKAWSQNVSIVGIFLGNYGVPGA